MLAKTTHHFSISPLLQEHICFLGQDVVYSRASEYLKMFRKIDIPAKQIARVCDYYGSILHQSELAAGRPDQLILKSSKVPSSQDPKTNTPVIIDIPSSYKLLRSFSNPDKDLTKQIMYVMMDGSYLQFRSEDGSHKDIWKEVKVGRVFFESHQVKEVSKNRNIIRYSDYIVSFGSVKHFLQKMEARLDDYTGTMVFINDGASWIWNWIEDAYPHAVQILDYFHAVEYLSGFAEKYFKETEEKAAWLELKEQQLNKDKVDKIIKELKEINSGSGKLTKECKDRLKATISYIENNQGRMLYGTYRSKGYMVGSGPIESTNRNIIQKRFKLSGQRWTESGAQNLATLRAFISSKRIDIVKKAIMIA